MSNEEWADRIAKHGTDLLDLAAEIRDGSPPDPPDPPDPPNYDGVIEGRYADPVIVPSGEKWLLRKAESQANVIVHGELHGQHDSHLRFVDVDEESFVGGGMKPLDTDVGLWADGGRLELHGGLIEGTPEGRSHIFIHSGRPQFLAETAILNMGPRRATGPDETEKVLGRYALHFHHCGDGSRDSFVRGVVALDSGSHCFVPHLSNGILFDECIADGWMEDAYWWDLSQPGADSQSHDIHWINCVARNGADEPGNPNYKLAGFTLGKGEGNKCIGCTASDIDAPKDSAGFHWHSRANSPPNVWEFRNCVAIRCQNGINVWQNSPSVHVLENFTCSEIRSFGIRMGAYANNYVVQGGDLNKHGILLKARSQAEAHSLRFVDVENIGALEIGGNNLGSQNPVLFLRSPLDSITLSKTTKPGAIDFVDSGVPVVWPSGNSTDGETFRFQNNGIASKHRWDGSSWAVADIDPFYTGG